MFRPRVLLVALAAALGLLFAPSALAEKPHFYSPPYIDGSNPPTVGDTLTGQNGGVGCSPACFKQTFQWFHCSANSNITSCVAVTDVTEKQEYVVQASDVGWSLVVQVTPWNHDCNEKMTECRDSSTSMNSAPTAPVKAAAGSGGSGSGTPPPPPPPPIPLTVLPAKLFPATPGLFYSVELGGSGGQAPYTCALTGGMLAFGLTMRGCTVRGTPLAVPGLFTFTVTVTDKNGLKGAKAYTVQIATPVILATPLGLVNATVGSFYLQTLGATGGMGPYTFSISDGALPAGVTLAPTGLLSGMPTKAGIYLFTVRIADATGGSATQTYRLVVSPKPTVVKKKPAPKKKPRRR